MPKKKKKGSGKKKKGGKRSGSSKGSSKSGSKSSRRSRSKSSKRGRSRGKSKSRSRSRSRGKTPEKQEENPLSKELNHGPRSVLNLSYHNLRQIKDGIIEIAIPSMAHWQGLREISFGGQRILDTRRFIASVILSKSKGIDVLDLSYNSLGKFATVASAKSSKPGSRPASGKSRSRPGSGKDGRAAYPEFYTPPPQAQYMDDPSMEALFASGIEGKEESLEGEEEAKKYEGKYAEEGTAHGERIKLPADPLNALFTIPTLTKIDLSGNTLGPESAKSIAAGICAFPYTFKSSESADNAAVNEPFVPCLKFLVCAKNNLQSEGVITLISVLQSHPALELLDISSNNICLKGARALAHAIHTQRIWETKVEGVEEYKNSQSGTFSSLSSLKVLNNPDMTNLGFDLLAEAVIDRPSLSVFLDYVTLNERPYLARKKIYGLILRNQFQSATVLQRNLKLGMSKIKSKRMKEWEMMQLEDTMEGDLRGGSSQKSSRKSSRKSSKKSSRKSSKKRGKSASKKKSKKGSAKKSGKKEKGKKGTKDKKTKAAAKKPRGGGGKNEKKKGKGGKKKKK